MEKIIGYSNCKFSFELKGDEGIYVDTLSTTVDSVIGILKEIVNETEPEAFVRLKVTKFDTGSFDIDFLALVESAKSIITDTDFIATGIVSIMGSVFAVKKFLDGKKAKKVEKLDGNKVRITNGSGQQMVTRDIVSDTLMNNCNVDKFIVNIFQAVEREEGKTALNIISEGDDKIVTISQEDFCNMKIPIYDADNKIAGTYVNKLTTTLQVRKPDLTGRSKWGFILDRQIDAAILDQEWLTSVHREKMAFSSGDCLKVDMTVEVGHDEYGDTIQGTERYLVTKVHGDIIRGLDDRAQVRW